MNRRLVFLCLITFTLLFTMVSIFAALPPRPPSHTSWPAFETWAANAVQAIHNGTEMPKNPPKTSSEWRKWMISALAATHTQIWAPPSPPKLLVSDPSLQPAVKDAFSQYGAAWHPAVYQQGVDPDNDGIFNPEEADAWPRDMDGDGVPEWPKIPSDWDREIALDWEGTWMTNLSGQKGQAKQTEAIEQGILALEHYQKLYPNAKIGFYGLPIHLVLYPPYWDPAALSGQRIATVADYFPLNEQLQKLYDKQGAFFPSVYDYNKNGENQWVIPKDDLDYALHCVEQALVQAGDRPVYVYIWQRYHDSNATWGLYLIEDAELIAHVSSAWSARRSLRSPAAIIWWTSETDVRRMNTEQSKKALQAEQVQGWTWQQVAERNEMRTLIQLSNIVYGTANEVPPKLEPLP